MGLGIRAKCPPPHSFSGKNVASLLQVRLIRELPTELLAEACIRVKLLDTRPVVEQSMAPISKLGLREADRCLRSAHSILAD